MAKSYRVKLEKEHLIFSAAHFITFAGNICERIHRHNYRVYAEVQASFDENQTAARPFSSSNLCRDVKP